jgi:hypothetical protein
MLDTRKIDTIRNNSEWCDAVCRAHGKPGEFNTDIWLNRHPVPRFYPNVVTLVEPCQPQLDLIDELVAAHLPHGWAAKDSFCTLDLASRGFQVLFVAEWIYLPVSRIRNIPISGKDTRWEVVRSHHALAEWESAWSRTAGDASEGRIIVPSLLENTNIAIVAGYHDSRIVAGAIANCSNDVIGWSNLFAPDSEVFDCAAASLATISGVFPSLPIVGYEHAYELRNAQALGFEALGPLRVWTFTASTT